MNRINIHAVVLWAALALGFQIFGGNWMMGLFIGLVFSLLVTLIPRSR